MKPSEFLKNNCSKELDKKINAIKNVDEWIELLCKELNERFIDREEFNNKLEQLKQIIRNAFTTTDENGNETCEINMGLIDTFIDEKIEELKQ